MGMDFVKNSYEFNLSVFRAKFRSIQIETIRNAKHSFEPLLALVFFFTSFFEWRYFQE